MLPFEDYIKGRMSGKRFNHSINVARAAKWLAYKYGENEEKAVIAGVLHDITKEWKTKQHWEFLHTHNIGLSNYEYSSKKLYHSITGSCFCKVNLRITDLGILRAIRFHTTARPKMTKLEKILYIADFISDDRHFDGVDRLRSLAYMNLDAAMFEGLSITINELSSEGSLIHPNTLHAYNEYVFNAQAHSRPDFLYDACVTTRTVK